MKFFYIFSDVSNPFRIISIKIGIGKVYGKIILAEVG